MKKLIILGSLIIFSLLVLLSPRNAIGRSPSESLLPKPPQPCQGICDHRWTRSEGGTIQFTAVLRSDRYECLPMCRPWTVTSELKNTVMVWSSFWGTLCKGNCPDVVFWSEAPYKGYDIKILVVGRGRHPHTLKAVGVDMISISTVNPLPHKIRLPLVSK